jgi:hypothetical protein
MLKMVLPTAGQQYRTTAEILLGCAPSGWRERTDGADCWQVMTNQRTAFEEVQALGDTSI